jgi:hypothetical protein
MHVIRSTMHVEHEDGSIVCTALTRGVADDRAAYCKTYTREEAEQLTAETGVTAQLQIMGQFTADHGVKMTAFEAQKVFGPMDNYRV